MPRPTKLNNEIIEDICKVISNGGTNTDACNVCCINPSTFYLWVSKAEEDKMCGKKSIYVEFSNELKKAESKYKLAHLGVINKAALKAETWQASAWLLERKFPKEFAKTDRIAVAKEEDNGMMKDILSAVQNMGISNNKDDDTNQ